jgi:fructosamine-3-kinase
MGALSDGGERIPVLFDPSSWYGHAEFDLALASMFGGFPRPFADAYHAIIPREPGFEERARVYKLYHTLNHLNMVSVPALSLCSAVNNVFSR